MKHAPFLYRSPSTRDEALALLAEHEDARPLAGGQSLMPMMAMRVLTPEVLVDLNGVADLAGLSEQGEALHIGAMTRQRTLERSPLVASRCPLMREALTHVGHRQTRNRGTLGGSLSHLDPSAELPAVALALDAAVHVQSVSASRSVDMQAFPQDLLTPDLEPGELVTGATIPYWPSGHGHAFVEFARRPGDFAIVAVAALLDAGEDGVIRRASLVVAGATPTPVRRTEAEGLLAGSRGDEVFDEATRAAADLEAMSDLHAGARYRLHLAATLVRRALDRALERSAAITKRASPPTP